MGIFQGRSIRQTNDILDWRSIAYYNDWVERPKPVKYTMDNFDVRRFERRIKWVSKFWTMIENGEYPLEDIEPVTGELDAGGTSLLRRFELSSR